MCSDVGVIRAVYSQDDVFGRVTRCPPRTLMFQASFVDIYSHLRGKKKAMRM